MDEPLTSRAATFDRLLLVWNGGDPGDVNELITTDYQGHMLHLPAGERSAQQYPQWIRDYRLASPGVTFEVVDQATGGDRLWTRLTATRADSAGVAHGMNVSRFDGERIAEEWAVWSDWQQ
jgi:SnoaL-like domain